jgi:UDP-N-acetylmuramate--alanine ligase
MLFTKKGYSMQAFDTDRPAVRTIGVTGTHGKGAVAGMLAWMLECAGWQPGFEVGGILDNFGTSEREPAGGWMVVEIDEEDRQQLEAPVDYLICNFLEFEGGAGGEKLARAIGDIIDSLSQNERLKEAFINLDCDGNRRLCERIGLRPTGYAVEHRAEFHGQVLGEAPVEFEAFHRNEALGAFELGLPGRYNVVNALGALAVARRLGVEQAAIRQGLASYAGMQSRLEGASGGGVTIVKERPRPVAVRQAIESLDGRVDKARLLCVFELPRDTPEGLEPSAWARAFSGVDEVLVTTPCGEGSGQGEAFTAALRQAGVEAGRVDQRDQVDESLLELIEPGDRVVFIGTDELFRVADRFLAEVTSRAQTAGPGPEQPRVSSPFADSNDDEEPR